METAIRLDGLTKHYGKHLGVAELNLEVKSGEVFGYLGPNGAGKTTTIRMLLDLIRPTSGKATVLGLDAQADSLAVRRSIGYIPSDPCLSGNLSGHDFLTYLANIRGGVRWAKVTALAVSGSPSRNRSKKSFRSSSRPRPGSTRPDSSRKFSNSEAP